MSSSSSTSSASGSFLAHVRFFLTVILGLSLDQITKVVAFHRLADWQTGYPFISGWVDFVIVRNPGAVFGMGPGYTKTFITVSILATIFIGYLFRKSRANQWLYQIVLGMLLAGVLGNMYDRIMFGFVRDMILLFPGRRIFPWVFNVADSLLCIGVGCIFVMSLFQRPQAEKKPGASIAARD